MSHPNQPLRRTAGLTLVDACIALAVTSVIVASVAPEMRLFADRHRLEAAARLLGAELQHARSSAVSLNRNVQVGFATGAGGSCWVVHTGSPGDCRCEAPSHTTCAPGAQALSAQHFSQASGISVRSNVASLGFDEVKGTVTPTGTLTLENRQQESVQVVVNIMGRVRACTPSPDLRGFPRC